MKRKNLKDCPYTSMKQTYLFIQYPKCSTCQKAKRFLNEHHIAYEERHIADNPPSADELRQWLCGSEYPVTKLLNTNGQTYRAMGLKDRIKTMSDDEILTCLASNGMLVKRPLLIGDGILLIGFKEAEWNLLCK